MQNMKHTPGPWLARPFIVPEWEDDPLGVYVLEPIREQLERRYTEAFEVGGDESPGQDAVCAENQANARLIAAAPELLEALRDLAQAARHFVKLPTDRNRERLMRLADGSADALIAEATGEPRQTCSCGNAFADEPEHDKEVQP